MLLKTVASGWCHEFLFDMALQIGAEDALGNEILSPISADTGSLYHVINDSSGNQLSYLSQGSSPKKIQIKNVLGIGSINAKIYINGKLLEIETESVPFRVHLII